MWILNFLPFWVIHLIVLVGAVGLGAATLLKIIPFVSTYRLPLQIVSIAVLVFGIYLEGGVSNQEMWEARVKEMEAKVAVAEEKAKTANAKIQYKFIDKVKVVHDVQVVIQEKIKEVATLIDSQCKMTPEAIDLLNAAAMNKKPGENK
jgi:hypothetical protein